MNNHKAEFVDWDHIQEQLVEARNDNIEKINEWAIAHQANLEAVHWLGLGYLKDKKAITWPERDETGQIVGIGCRAIEGKRKWMIPTSKHGLIYASDPEHGGVPSYIDHPILILEGMTDVMACLARGIYAIGRPSATGTVESNAWLGKMVKGHKVALVCENDKGVGAIAFLNLAEPLAKKTNAVYAIYPPAYYKDIREWFKAEPDAIAQIEDQIIFRRPWSDDPGIIAVGDDILRDTAPRRIADQLIEECFSHMGISTLRYWNGSWYEFSDNHYSSISYEHVRAHLYEFLDRKKTMEKQKGPDGQWIEKPCRPTMQKVTQVIDALKSLPSVLVPPKTSMPYWLDKILEQPVPYEMIVFKNGCFDVRSYLESNAFTLLPPTASWFSQTHIPYDLSLDKIVQAKPFVNFLMSVFNGDQQPIDLFQEWLGYCMTGDNQFETFMMFVGRPASGKGTTMDVMAKVIGLANIFFARIDQLGSRFGLFGAVGKTNVFMTDAHAKDIDKAASFLENLKTITGNGPIDVEAKGKDVFSQRLIARFTMGVNDLPNFHDAASALNRRLLLLSFPNSYAHKMDTRLKKQLTEPSVVQGVAVWALEGLRRLMTNRKFTVPKSSLSRMSEFQRVNSPITSFVNERCNFEAEAWVPKDKLFEAWKSYCSEHDLQPNSNVIFARGLFRAFNNIETGKKGSSGNQTPVYRGLSLKP